MPKKNPFKKRSKLEKYIETYLKSLYPELYISFNNRKALGGPELDIYIPRLKLAIEINGIHHHSPIYGLEKLAQIQEQDCKKKRLCKASGIRLVVLDTHEAGAFSKEQGEAFLGLVCAEVDVRL